MGKGHAAVFDRSICGESIEILYTSSRGVIICFIVACKESRIIEYHDEGRVEVIIAKTKFLFHT